MKKYIFSLIAVAMLMGGNTAHAQLSPNDMRIVQVNPTNTGNITVSLPYPATFGLAGLDPATTTSLYRPYPIELGTGLSISSFFLELNQSLQDLAGISAISNDVLALLDSATTQDFIDGLALQISDITSLQTTLDDKANTSALSDVAFSGDYEDLLNLPTLFDGNYNSLSNLPSLFSGDYNDLTNKPTLGSMASQDTSDFYTFNEINTLLSWSFNSNPGRSLTSGTGATGFMVSSSRNSDVSYTVTVTTTATIGGASAGYVVLEIAPTNSSTAGDWIEVSRCGNSQTITLALVLQSVQGVTCSVQGSVPAGYYSKIRQVVTAGSPSFSIGSQQEVLK